MITKLYGTFDKKAKAFNERIFQAPNDDVAIRSVETTQLRDEFLNVNANDYEVYCVGLYDAETGEIKPEKRLVKKLTQKSEKDIQIRLMQIQEPIVSEK